MEVLSCDAGQVSSPCPALAVASQVVSSNLKLCVGDFLDTMLGHFLSSYFNEEAAVGFDSTSFLTPVVLKFDSVWWGVTAS